MISTFSEVYGKIFQFKTPKQIGSLFPFKDNTNKVEEISHVVYKITWPLQNDGKFDCQNAAKLILYHKLERDPFIQVFVNTRLSCPFEAWLFCLKIFFVNFLIEFLLNLKKI